MTTHTQTLETYLMEQSRNAGKALGTIYFAKNKLHYLVSAKHYQDEKRRWDSECIKEVIKMLEDCEKALRV